MRIVGTPYWRLRDYHHRARRRTEAAQRQEQRTRQIKAAALAAPTYGYRRLWRVLKGDDVFIGRERLRRLLRRLGLSQPMIRKLRRKPPPVRIESEWPEDRRVQIDATRLSLNDGVG